MSNIVERVARAMVAADSGPEGSQLFDIHWNEFGPGYLVSARVAIEAMREITDEMLEAAYEAVKRDECWSIETSDDYRVAHDAVIAAALKPEVRS